MSAKLKAQSANGWRIKFSLDSNITLIMFLFGRICCQRLNKFGSIQENTIYQCRMCHIREIIIFIDHSKNIRYINISGEYWNKPFHSNVSSFNDQICKLLKRLAMHDHVAVFRILRTVVRQKYGSLLYSCSFLTTVKQRTFKVWKNKSVKANLILKPLCAIMPI